jgi:transposase
MPAQRLTMRRVRELLRLHYGVGASARAVARELGVSRSTVKEYLARAAAAELVWPLPAEITDAVLEERLFAAGGPKPVLRRRVEPDWGSAGPRDEAAGRQSDGAVGGVACQEKP